MLVMRVMAAELTQRLLPSLRDRELRLYRQLIIGATVEGCISMRRLARRLAVRLQAAAYVLNDLGDGHAAADAAQAVRCDVSNV